MQLDSCWAPRSCKVSALGRGWSSSRSPSMSDTKKRKRNGRDDGGWSSDDSEAAEERSEHHYMLRVGDEFDHGRYTVVQQLGKGTFGRVVEMWDKTEKTAVAVKVVRAVEKCVAAAMNARFLLQ